MTQETRGKAHCLVLKRKYEGSGVFLWYKESEREKMFKPAGGILITDFKDRHLPPPKWQATQEPESQKLAKIAEHPRLQWGGAVFGKTEPQRQNWVSLTSRAKELEVCT